jgi:hypothetical protein
MSTPNESVLLVNPLFEPFCKKGLVLAPDGREHPIHVLRDSGALQSVIRESSVPDTAYTQIGEIRLLRGISNAVIEVPLISLHLKTDGLDQTVLVGVIEQLPEGVDFLLGNDLWLISNSLPESEGYNAVVTRSASRLTVDKPPVLPLTQSNPPSPSLGDRVPRRRVRVTPSRVTES